MAGQTHPVQQFLASKVRCTLSLMLILSWCELTAIGMRTVSPMTVAPVCRVGDPLQITCTASVEFIQWSIVVTNEHGMGEEVTAIRNSLDLSPLPKQRIINSTTFTFTRTSAQGASPLISTLSIGSVNTSLNETVVSCMDANNPMVSASTTIQIINVNMYTPTLRVISEEYFPDNITVTVEWARVVGAAYTARLSPLALATLSTGSNSQQLILFYNTEYNLSVVAATPCGNATAFIQLSYVNCGHPNLLPQVSNDSVPIIEGYDNIPVEGSIIRFSCPTGLQLTGPNSAICTGNGEWEPDTNSLMCNDSKGTCGHPFQNRASVDNDSLIIIMGYMDPAMEGTTVTLVCPSQYILVGTNATTCMGNGEWEPDPREAECKGIEGEKIEESSSTVLTTALSSTVVAFVVISLLTFVAGFVCGHFFGQKRTKATSSQPVALYEDVSVLPSAVEHQEQHLELKDNVAYGPLKSTEQH